MTLFMKVISKQNRQVFSNTTEIIKQRLATALILVGDVNVDLSLRSWLLTSDLGQLCNWSSLLMPVIKHACAILNN